MAPKLWTLCTYRQVIQSFTPTSIGALLTSHARNAERRIRTWRAWPWDGLDGLRWNVMYGIMYECHKTTLTSWRYVMLPDTPHVLAIIHNSTVSNITHYPVTNISLLSTGFHNTFKNSWALGNAPLNLNVWHNSITYLIFLCRHVFRDCETVDVALTIMQLLYKSYLKYDFFCQFFLY